MTTRAFDPLPTTDEAAWRAEHNPHGAWEATVEGPTPNKGPLMVTVLVCEQCDTMLVVDVERAS